MPVVDVAVPVPLKQSFSYLHDTPVATGVRVKVPFGNRTLIGVVIGNIEAQTEDTGLITYRFQNVPVLLIGYAPLAANHEVRFPGVQRIVQRADELQGQPSSVPSTLQGAVRLASRVSNTTPGAEAGELDLQVFIVHGEQCCVHTQTIVHEL